MDEFQDWELLQSDPVSDSENQISFEDFGADSEGMIRNDYFSIDDNDRYMNTVHSADASYNLDLIDLASETRDLKEVSGELCPELVVDRSEDPTLEEFEGKGEMCILGNEKIQGGFGGSDETGDGDWNNFEQFKSGCGGNEFGGSEFEEFEDNKELVVENDENLCDVSEIPEREHEIIPTGVESMSGIVEVEMKKEEVVKKSVVWWQAPFELLKYCVFRVKPVWTISIAAALLGFAVLGRRIYKMKKKARSLELKVTLDDKKVSKFMSQAARLNEAFSVVKRVPVIRPQLPASGVAPWPVMTKLTLQDA